MEKILPYKCRCGGTLKKSQTNVEFFGIDFGIKEKNIKVRIEKNLKKYSLRISVYSTLLCDIILNMLPLRSTPISKFCFRIYLKTDK